MIALEQHGSKIIESETRPVVSGGTAIQVVVLGHIIFPSESDADSAEVLPIAV